ATCQLYSRLSSSRQLTFLFFLHSSRFYPGLPSFPTRRSSDLSRDRAPRAPARRRRSRCAQPPPRAGMPPRARAREPSPSCPTALDRKSTRLNSSHVAISYAVFCLKKKNKPHSHDQHLRLHPTQ